MMLDDEKMDRNEKKLDAFTEAALTATIRLVAVEEARLTGIPMDDQSENGILAVLLGNMLNRFEKGRPRNEVRAELLKMINDIYPTS
jgi:hypothetical protein